MSPIRLKWWYRAHAYARYYGVADPKWINGKYEQLCGEHDERKRKAT